MPTYSTVIICRQVVEVVTAFSRSLSLSFAVFCCFEDDECCARVSINLIGQREKWEAGGSPVYASWCDEVARCTDDWWLVCKSKRAASDRWPFMFDDGASHPSKDWFLARVERHKCPIPAAAVLVYWGMRSIHTIVEWLGVEDKFCIDVRNGWAKRTILFCL